MARPAPVPREPPAAQPDNLSRALALIAAEHVAWIWTIDPHTGRLDVNGDLSGLFGKHIDNVDDLMAVFHPDDVERAAALLSRALTEGVGGEMTIRALTAAGPAIHFHVTFRTEPHPLGGFHVHGISHNVTGWVEARQALRAENELAARAEHLAGVGYWRHDLSSDVHYWSAEMYLLHGVDPADGPPATEVLTTRLCHPDDWERLRQFATVEGAHASQVEFRIVRPSGEVRHVMLRTSLERDEAGRVVARFGTMADVTEIKKAEAAARQSDQRYRFMADNAPDMIARIRLPGGIDYVSPGSLRVFGYTPEEHMRLTPQEMIHPEDAARVIQTMDQLIADRRPRLPEPLVYRARHKDGRWIWIESNPTLVFDDDGVPIETIDIVRDVTQARLAEAALGEALQRAEAAAAAKSAFLANMSHELRTPLTSIIGFSRLIGERADLPAETRGYALRVSEASEALSAVINDVLDYSKLEAGRMALEAQPLSVRRLVEEATGLIALEAAAHGLGVNVELDAATPALIVGDVARLRQVLVNLLSNAVKFTREGSVTVSTRWRSTRRGGRLRFSVTDTGVGIGPDHKSRLFERFSQAEVSINRAKGGTGLGLAICKSLVELMGGRIGVRSRLGQGASFWFEVPASIAASSSPAPSTAAGPEPDYGPLRLLMVDDTAMNRELVKLMLGPAGLLIEEACGGEEGVGAAMARPFDLILMDVRMPGIDGLEATRRIRASGGVNCRTPILALTADVHPDTSQACQAAGMNEVLTKPIVPAQLLSKIAEWANADADQQAAPERSAGRRRVV